eukprot:6213777-Pleurochrysis_carterae.AAC.1
MSGSGGMAGRRASKNTAAVPANTAAPATAAGLSAGIGEEHSFRLPPHVLTPEASARRETLPADDRLGLSHVCRTLHASVTSNTFHGGVLQELAEIGQTNGMQPHEPSSVPPRGVFCTSSLDLTKIKCIGYDMDYTLIDYKMEVRSLSA